MSDTLTEFPRQESPLQFDARRRKAQAMLDFKQADSEAMDLAGAGDQIGFHRARARAYGHLAESVDESHRASMIKNRNDDLDTVAGLARRAALHSPELARFTGAIKSSSEKPRDPALFWQAAEVANELQDEDNQRLATKWLPDLYRDFQKARVEGELDDAVGKVNLALLRKRVDRRNRSVPLDDDEQMRISLEVMQELPKEFAIYDRAMLTGKTRVPDTYFRFAHPELGGPKEWQLYQRSTQEAIRKYGPDATPEQIDAEFAMMKRGETPSAQQAKVELQRAQTDKAKASAQYDRERGVAGVAGIRPETMTGLTLAKKRLLDMLNAVAMSPYTDKEKTEQSTILKGEIADVDRRMQEYETAKRGRAPGAASGYTPAGKDLFLRMKALYDADTDPRKGSWADPAVRKRYKQRAEQPGQ